MLLGYPIGEIALLALWIAGAGVLVGILAGLFGIGGGAIIAPVRYEVFRVLDVPEEVRMQTCIGASLAIIVPTTVRSYFGHKKKGAVIPEVVRICALPAIIGVAIGSVTASSHPHRYSRLHSYFLRHSSRCACCSVGSAGSSETNCLAAVCWPFTASSRAYFPHWLE